MFWEGKKPIVQWDFPSAPQPTTSCILLCRELFNSSDSLGLVTCQMSFACSPSAKVWHYWQNDTVSWRESSCHHVRLQSRNIIQLCSFQNYCKDRSVLIYNPPSSSVLHCVWYAGSVQSPNPWLDLLAYVKSCFRRIGGVFPDLTWQSFGTVTSLENLQAVGPFLALLGAHFPLVQYRLTNFGPEMASTTKALSAIGGP